MSNPNYYYLPQPPREWSRVENRCLNFSNYYELQMLKKGNILQYKKNSGNLTKAQLYSRIAKGQWINRNTTWANQSTRGATNPNTNSLKRVGSVNIAIDPITGQILGPTIDPISCPQPIVNQYDTLPITDNSSTAQPPVPPPPPPAPPSGPTVPPVPQPIDPSPIVIQDGGNLICSVVENICTGETRETIANQLCYLTTDSDVPGKLEPLCWNDGVATWYPRQRYVMTNSTNKWPFTSGNPKPVLTSALKPVPPILSLTSINSCKSITLSWTESIFCYPISNYYIYQNGVLIDIVSNTTNTITINNIPTGQNNFYVTAISNSIESDTSNIIEFTSDLTYLATGNYTIYNNNGYTGIVFEYPSGTIQFNCSILVNLLLIGGGGGGGGSPTFTAGGGGGGGIYLNNSFNIDTNTYNIIIGKGGSGYLFPDNQLSGGNTTITNGMTNYFANGGGISYSNPSGTFGGIGGNSSDGFSTGGNGGDFFPLSNGQNSTYISTLLPFTSSPTTLYLSGGGGTYKVGTNAGFAGKGYGGISGTFIGINGENAVQTISAGGYGGGGGSGSNTGGNGGNGVAIIWWQN